MDKGMVARQFSQTVKLDLKNAFLMTDNHKNSFKLRDLRISHQIFNEYWLSPSNMSFTDEPKIFASMQKGSKKCYSAIWTPWIKISKWNPSYFCFMMSNRENCTKLSWNKHRTFYCVSLLFPRGIDLVLTRLGDLECSEQIISSWYFPCPAAQASVQVHPK